MLLALPILMRLRDSLASEVVFWICLCCIALALVAAFAVDVVGDPPYPVDYDF